LQRNCFNSEFGEYASCADQRCFKNSGYPFRKNSIHRKKQNTEGGEKLTASGRVVTNEEGKPVKAYVV
jgi:hypothetical protein